MIRLKKGLASSYWEEIILAIIGEQFDVGNEICGAVCRYASVFKYNFLSVVIMRGVLFLIFFICPCLFFICLHTDGIGFLSFHFAAVFAQARI